MIKIMIRIIAMVLRHLLLQQQQLPLLILSISNNNDNYNYRNNNCNNNCNNYNNNSPMPMSIIEKYMVNNLKQHHFNLIINSKNKNKKQCYNNCNFFNNNFNIIIGSILIILLGRKKNNTNSI